MNKNLLLTICLSVAINGFAQLPSKVEVGLPAVLAKPLISEKDVASVNASNNWGQNNKRNLFWNALLSTKIR